MIGPVCRGGTRNCPKIVTGRSRATAPNMTSALSASRRVGLGMGGRLYDVLFGNGGTSCKVTFVLFIDVGMKENTTMYRYFHVFKTLVHGTHSGPFEQEDDCPQKPKTTEFGRELGWTEGVGVTLWDSMLPFENKRVGSEVRDENWVMSAFDFEQSCKGNCLEYTILFSEVT